MLVVADQLAVGVGGQGGLAGAGQAEEHGAVAVVADVGGAVHREHAFLGQDIIHHGEDALLDFSGVLGAADDDQLILIVDQDGSLGAGVIHLRDALEAGGSDDGVIFLEAFQLLGRRTAQQLMDEQVLAGQLVDDAEGLGVLGIRAGEAIKDKYFFILQVGDHLIVDGVEVFLADRTVYLAPGDIVMHGRGIHDELVVGAAAGILAGLYHQRAGVAQRALLTAQRSLYKLGGGQIAIDRLGIDDAILFDAVGIHRVASFIDMPGILSPAQSPE